ncbi:MAG: rhodanese-like domain-containing protein [Pseudomonadota bacterium]
MTDRRTFLAVSAAAVLASGLPAAASEPAARIGLQEAYDQSTKGELMLVDIRTPGEWAKSGIGETAQTISMHLPDFLKKLSAATGGDKGRRIALICAAGHRSDWLQARLKRYGYENTYSVSEGMLGSKDGPGWIRRGLPTKPHK